MTVKKSFNKKPTEVPYISELVSFGLSENEAKVYLYLLQSGKESGGSKIAIGAKIHRQYVYLSLRHLIEINLVDEIKYGKHGKYKARPPAQLEKIAKKKIVETTDLVEQLGKISKVGYEQDFEVMQGIRSIQQFEMEVVKNTENSEEFIIGGHTEGFRELMGDLLDEYLEIKKKKNIKVKYIGSENEKSLYEKYIGIFPNQEYRFISRLPQGVTHMVIRDKEVSFYSFLTPPLVYVIKSQMVAKNYKEFFMMLWEMAGENK